MLKCKSFTLIELVTSVSIFAILTIVVLSLYSTIVTKHRAAVETQMVNDNIRYAMEVMSRDIEEGRIRALMDKNEETGKYTTLVINLSSKNPGSDCSSNVEDCLKYHFDMNENQLEVKTKDEPNCDFSKTDGEEGDCPAITSSNVIVEDLSFYIDDSIAGNNDRQPRTTIVIKAKAKNEKTGISGITLQKTIDQKDLVNEYVGKVKVVNVRVRDNEGTKENDCYVTRSSSINTQEDFLKVGRYETNLFDIGMRFFDEDGDGEGDITIPKGATILNAIITFEAYLTKSGNMRTFLIGENSDNADDFSGDDANTFASRPRTSASVEWDFSEGWEEGKKYSSPNIKDIIKEIINQPGWVPGNAIVIFWEESNSDSDTERKICSADCDWNNCDGDNTDDAPILHIEYIE